MKNSSLYYVIKSQHGLSMHKYVKEKINNILLFEGYTDWLFYKRFLYNNKYRDFFKVEEEKASVKSMVLQIYLDGKNIYAIIDPDYKNATNIDKRIRDRIHVIDANSLETLLVKYSDKDHNVLEAISNFDNLLRKGEILQNAHNYKRITDDVLKWSFYIGSIRKINDLKNYGLRFKFVKEKSNYYTKYIKISKEENYKKLFNQEEYLKDLCDESGYENDIKILQTIKDKMEEYNERTVWDMCQGHDIFDFIECLSSSSYYSETAKGKMPNRTNGIPDWEYTLLKVFDTNNFISSPLQNWFDEIQS